MASSMPKSAKRIQTIARNAIFPATASLLLCSLSVNAQDIGKDYDAVLSGKIRDVTRPEAIWIGAIEIRLRTPYILEEKRDEALDFMRALAPQGRDVECRLTGERTSGPGGGVLFGDCFVVSTTDDREINLGDRLIDLGFARACADDIAVIQIWPPVFDCQ